MANNQPNAPTASASLASSFFRNVSLAQIDNTRLLSGRRGSLCAGPCGTIINHQDPSDKTWELVERCRHCRTPLWCSPQCAQFHGQSIRLDPKGPLEILVPSSQSVHEAICRGISSPPFGGRTHAHHEACLFPVGESTGQLIWVRYDLETAELTVEDTSFHVFGMYPYREPTRRVLLRDTLELQGWTFEYDLLLISYPQASTESTPLPYFTVNSSIAALARPLQLKTWVGPVVVVAVSHNPSGEHCFVHSVNFRDISAAVIYHLRHSDNSCRPLFPSPAENVYPALKLTNRTNHYINFAFGRQPAMAPVLVPS
ncbi:predicted protein [Chaetomium globosum CBS 148.51]|uniref:Uncharacterized protein n=1 Tax=Chaetomium globosum (strain ATCC 6205 / CBS 148.51 / DSM 1962 / NBRC 6347 / NRRL 1970) TaxID=306901 RepID=Q2H1U0_CHAGB|nr:uncharacterized protein CHGG_04256 [Chaetomium globosum CBS 148.51]EAQ87637.1 predicted protein [Chaetomium globosum CBS 148.51]